MSKGLEERKLGILKEKKPNVLGIERTMGVEDMYTALLMVYEILFLIVRAMISQRKVVVGGVISYMHFKISL